MVLLEIALTLDILSFAAAIAMTFEAWRAHNIIRSKQSLVFFLTFALISVGIFLRLTTDLLVTVGPPFITQVTGLGALIGSQKAFLLLSALCILSGYTLLLLVVEKITQKSMWVLVFMFILLTMFLATNVFILSHIVTIILLLFLSLYYWKSYKTKQNRRTLLIYTAFMLLIVGHTVSLLVSLGLIPRIIFLSLRLIAYFMLYAVMWRATRK